MNQFGIQWNLCQTFAQGLYLIFVETKASLPQPWSEVTKMHLSMDWQDDYYHYSDNPISSAVVKCFSLEIEWSFYEG